jgi:DNA-binding Xre family transcriptional regulator
MPTTKPLPVTVSPTFLLGNSKSISQLLTPLHPTLVGSAAATLLQSLSQATKDTLWISYDPNSTEKLLRAMSWPVKPLGNAMLFHALSPQTLPAIQHCFGKYAYAIREESLPPDELVEALLSGQRHDLIIGGIVDQSSKTITFWRGHLDSLTVPFSAFETSGDGIVPDFRQFSVTDCGQTVRLGAYEAATDAILYEFDPDYRRRIGKQRLASEQSFGASLRRLRKQRGKRRVDFAPVSAKTIARIEQGFEHAIRETTLHTIAKTLGVTPDEIETY